MQSCRDLQRIFRMVRRRPRRHPPVPQTPKSQFASERIIMKIDDALFPEVSASVAQCSLYCVWPRVSLVRRRHCVSERRGSWVVALDARRGAKVAGSAEIKNALFFLLACPLLTVPSTKKKSSSGQNQRSSMQSLLDMCISRLSSRPELLLRQGDLPMDDLVELILNGAGVSRLDEALLSTLHASLLAIGSDARCLDHAWHRLLQRDFPKKATCESGWRDVYLNESAAKRARFDAAKARVLSSQTQQAARSRIKRSKISVKS